MTFDTVDGQPAKTGPCSGLLVVDMSSLVSGPLGSRILADLGAIVVKVETPTSDPAMRANPPVYRGHAAYYEQVNFGKKSILADPKTPEGLAVIQALAKRADVLFQNSRPGAMEKLGLGYEQLKVDNPKLVYVSVTGFGETGSYSSQPAYDVSVQGIVGFMPVQGTADHPQAIYAPVADKISAIWAANGAMAALLHRERTGEGQKVVVSMVAAYASFILPEEMGNETFRSAEVPRAPTPKQPYQAVATADGFVVGLILMPLQYKAFCQAIGRGDLADDPAYVTSAGLVHGIARFYGLIADDVKRYTTSEFLAIMAKANLPFAKINTPAEFMLSDVAAEAQAYVDVEDPEFGTIRHLNHPVSYSKSHVDVTRRAPKLGEQTDEILAMVGVDITPSAAG